MGEITITVDSAAVEAALQVLGPASSLAIARALNKAAGNVQVSVLRTLSTEIGLPQRAFRGSVKVQRVTAAAVTESGATAKVTARGGDISLRHFQARQTRKGVTFKPGRKVKRRLLEGAFIATARGGSRQVFIRAQNAKNVRVDSAANVRRRKRVRPRGPDLPIAKITVPGVSSTLLDATIRRTLEEEGAVLLERRLVEEINFELSKVKR